MASSSIVNTQDTAKCQVGPTENAKSLNVTPKSDNQTRRGRFKKIIGLMPLIMGTHSRNLSRFKRHQKPLGSNVADYEFIRMLGEGSYGHVWLGRERNSERTVAIKQIRQDRYHYVYFQREVEILCSVHHPNIVELKGLLGGRYPLPIGPSHLSNDLSCSGQSTMAFEYLEYDLRRLLHSGTKFRFNISQTKCIIMQVLKGLEHCHSQRIIHRDIKPANLLISKDGVVKIADFGLARKLDSVAGVYSPNLVSMWYRSPELLLGAREYGTSVDMWAVGCLLLELLVGRPIFQGDHPVDMLRRIFDAVGNPDDEDWPNWRRVGIANMITLRTHAGSLHTFIFWVQQISGIVLTPAFLNIISGLLELNPDERISAGDAILHTWFREAPLAGPKHLLIRV